MNTRAGTESKNPEQKIMKHLLRRRFLRRAHWGYVFVFLTIPWLVRMSGLDVPLRIQQMLGEFAGAVVLAFAGTYFGLSAASIFSSPAIRTTPVNPEELRKTCVRTMCFYDLIPFLLIHLQLLAAGLVLNKQPVMTGLNDTLTQGFGLISMLVLFLVIVNVYAGTAFAVTGVNKFTEFFSTTVFALAVLMFVTGVEVMYSRLMFPDTFFVRESETTRLLTAETIKLLLLVIFWRTGVVWARGRIRGFLHC